MRLCSRRAARGLLDRSHRHPALCAGYCVRRRCVGAVTGAPGTLDVAALGVLGLISAASIFLAPPAIAAALRAGLR